MFGLIVEESGDSLYKGYIIRIVVMVVSYWELACLPRLAIMRLCMVSCPTYETRLSILLQDRLPHPNSTGMSKIELHHNYRCCMLPSTHSNCHSYYAY